MRIALVSQTASPGLTNFRRDLICDLISEGHNVFTFANNFTEHEFLDLRSLGAVPVLYPNDRAGLNPIKDLKTLLVLVRLFQKHDIDICFSFFLKPALYGSLASYFAGVKKRIFMLEGLGHVFTDTNKSITLKKFLLRYLIGAIYSIASRCVDDIIFLNPDDPIDLSRYSFVQKNKIVIVPGIGVDLARYELTPPTSTLNGFTFLMISRLLTEKGLLEFIEAAKRLKATRPDVIFKIAGGFDEANPAGVPKTIIFEAVEQGVIEYHGHVTNIETILGDSHVLVLPSYREGFPRVIQEAMASGRAIITTDVPGCRQAVNHNETGVIVQPYQILELYNAMNGLVQDPERCTRLSIAAQKYARKNFDVKDANRRFIKVLLGT